MTVSRPGVSNRLIEQVSLRAWQEVISPRTALVILVLLLTAALLGALVPQVPSGLVLGSRQYDAWLGQACSDYSAMAFAYGAAVGSFDSLGLTRLFTSRLFRLLLAGAAGISLLRMLHLCIPSWASLPPRQASQQTLSLPWDADETWHRASRALALAGLGTTRRLDSHGVQYALARRIGWRRWLPGLFYLGLLAMLLATVVEGQLGWVGRPVELALGETQPLDRSTGLTVRLEQIAFLPRDDGSMRRFDSLVWLLRGGIVVKRVVVGPGRPATYQGLTLYQLDDGPAVQIGAWNAEGKALQIADMAGRLAAQPHLRFSGQQQEQLLAIPQADLVVRLLHYPSLPARGIRGRALHVQVRRGSDGQLLAEEFLSESGSIATDDATIQIAFQHYVTLRAEREPGLFLAATGGVLVVAGMIAFLLLPRREVWLSVRPRQEGRPERSRVARPERSRGESSREQWTTPSVCELVVAERDADSPWFLSLRSALGEEDDD